MSKLQSQAGQRIALIDVPKTATAADFNGIQVVDWGTHDPDFVGQLHTCPATLADEIEAKFGRDPVGDCNKIQRTAAGIAKFRDQLVDRIKTKTELSRHFLNQGDWDLFLTVFTESHCMGHQCWNLHDRHHPKHDAAIAAVVGDPLLSVYTAIDRGIGELLAEVDDETAVFVFTSHGMGPHYDGTFLLDDILARLEQTPPSASRQQVAKVLNANLEEKPGIGWLVKPLKRFLWRPLRRYVWKTDKPLRTALAEPDASRRRCFTVPNNDVYGAIRINLVGREPKGQVHPGTEYDAFCAALTQDLLAITNVETGQPLVKRVLRTADVYQGEYLDTLPDLLVEWNRDQPIRRITSDKMGTIEKTFDGVRTGDHLPHGLFITLGPDLQPGPLSETVSVMDFAPTLAALLDVPLPDVDGQPIESVMPRPMMTL
ncbi:MAG: alkaline phosphatase family protein [Cyanobacteria bacterium P01_D01_bin.115]